MAGRIGGLFLIGGAIGAGVAIATPDGPDLAIVVVILASWGLGLGAVGEVGVEPFGSRRARIGLRWSAIASIAALLAYALLSWFFAIAGWEYLFIFAVLPGLGLVVIACVAGAIGLAFLAAAFYERGGIPRLVGAFLVVAQIAAVAAVVIGIADPATLGPAFGTLAGWSFLLGIVGIGVLAILAAGRQGTA